MRPRFRELPGLLAVAVLAFAQFERRPLLAGVGLFRGLAVQLAYRWGCRRVLGGDGHAVLLWSEPTGPQRRRIGRELCGVAAGVLVGLTLCVLSGAPLLLIADELLDALRVPPGWQAGADLTVLTVLLGRTGWGAVAAYRLSRARQAAFPDFSGRCCRIDYLAAAPLGRGHGGRLLDRFVDLADRAEANLVLVTDERNRAFYRRHGFRVHPSDSAHLAGNLLMVRRAPQLRAARAVQLTANVAPPA